VAKNHAAQIIPEASNVFRIGGRAESLGELKELRLLALLRLDPLFDEFDDDPVGAQASLLRQAADLPRRVSRKAHGLANDFVRSGHGTIIHQIGDARSSAPGACMAPCDICPGLRATIPRCLASSPAPTHSLAPYHAKMSDSLRRRVNLHSGMVSFCRMSEFSAYR